MQTLFFSLFLPILVTSLLGPGPDEPSSGGAGPRMTAPSDAKAPRTVGSVERLPDAVKREMSGVSHKEGCPVSLDDLRLVRVPYLDFDDERREGELVVHHTAAEDLRAAFVEMFAAGFQIERIERIDAFGGDDDASMAANNTSAFNCRPVIGRSKGFSRHSYGIAIDINPRINPYVSKSGKVSPPEGKQYADREVRGPGVIHRGDACHRALTTRGFAWGGAWRRTKDYQHFERPRPPASAPKAPPPAAPGKPAAEGSTGRQK